MAVFSSHLHRATLMGRTPGQEERMALMASASPEATEPTTTVTEHPDHVATVFVKT